MSFVAGAGMIAIGRNEGERLKRCLTAAVGQADHVVYVDSGSTDGSTEFARTLGVEVVDLDLSLPFTAARARNAGYRRLIEAAPDTRFVQFVDGDCELVDGFILKGLAAFAEDEKLGVVSGRRRERDRDATIYNRLCDMEWDTPIGPCKSCHGDALMRRSAFEQAGKFDETMIAGEEPELCVRLRSKGWTLVRIDSEMTMHDAAMTRFSQWWKRNVRAGHAYAEGADKHGGPPEMHNVKQVRSAMVWGHWMLLWVTVFALLCGLSPWFLIGMWTPLLLVCVMMFKVARYRRHSRGDAWREALIYGMFTMIGKVPTARGILTYRRNKRAGKRSGLIEYKSEGAVGG